ncbi:hypothetical protein fugu_006270 [Takifugu bimaculatus]|uniref:Uncharacterized protein n=1 Tax=Takifugu bimaculatus TaxID=433685 RepID=A0A4Z2B8A7_9TELE|nr:hypothetical protein fugu_006270 [Takifugu bimaculatus]
MFADVTAKRISCHAVASGEPLYVVGWRLLRARDVRRWTVTTGIGLLGQRDQRPPTRSFPPLSSARGSICLRRGDGAGSSRIRRSAFVSGMQTWLPGGGRGGGGRGVCLFLLRFHPARVLETAQRLGVCGLSPPDVFTRAVCVFPM